MKFLAGASLLAVAVSAMPTSLGERGGADVCNAARAISIVVDSSASNKGTDPRNLRLAASSDVVNGLNFAQDRVSVVSFNDQSTLLYALGSDKDAALRAISQIPAKGNTKISEGLGQGLEQIINLGKDARDHAGVVVFTDGLDYTKEQQLQLLRKAKEAGIRVSWGHLSADEVHPKNGKRSLAGDGELEERTFGMLKNVMTSVVSMFCGIGKGFGGLGGSLGGGLGGGSSGGSSSWGSGSASGSLVTGGSSNIVVRPGSPLDQEISAACLSTGGTVSIIGNANAQQSFIQQVIKNGVTNNDGRCSGLDVDQSGGLLRNNVTSLGLCSNNAQAEFFYSPEKTKEKLAFTVSLVSITNKVSIKAVFVNTVTGARNEITVNSQNPSHMLTGEANVGEKVKVTITPSGASADTCQYSVGLIAVADSLVQSASSSLVIEGTLIEEGTIVGQHTQNVEEHIKQTGSQSVSQPQVTPSGPVPSPSAPAPSSSQTVSTPVVSPSYSTSVPPASPPPSYSTSVPPASPPPSYSTSVPPASPPPSHSASVPPASPPPASPTPSTTECPTYSAEVVTKTQTETLTVTEGPKETPGICICKCDVKGAKPFPRAHEL